MDGDVMLENREDIFTLIEEFFVTLCSKEEWVRPSLDNLQFSSIWVDKATWLEREFEVEA